MGKPTVAVIKTSGSWRDAADAIVADTRARYNQADNSYPGNATSHSGDPHASDGIRLAPDKLHTTDGTHIERLIN